MTLRFIAGLSVTRRRQILTAFDHKAVSSILCTRPTHQCLMSARFSYRTAELVGKSTSAFDVHVDFPKLKRPGPLFVSREFILIPSFSFNFFDTENTTFIRCFFYGQQSTFISLNWDLKTIDRFRLTDHIDRKTKTSAWKKIGKIMKANVGKKSTYL